MHFSKVLAAAAVAVASLTGVLALPQAPSPTVNLSDCPTLSYVTLTQTLGIQDATYTGVTGTTTLTLLVTNYPTATTTQVETEYFSGTLWVGSPVYTPEVTEYTTTYSRTLTYENYYGFPPFPSDCPPY